MGLRNPPLWVQNGSHSAENDRLLGTQGLVGTAGVSTGTNDLLVTQASTPAMAVNVNTGWAWILGTVGTSQGMYTTYNDAVISNLPVTAANASLPRIDRVCLVLTDTGYGGATSSSVYASVITGVASASPVAPSVPASPASSITLATIAVASGATSITNANITDARVRATMALSSGSSGGAGYPDLFMLGGM
jgi:hypothetical protein